MRADHLIFRAIMRISEASSLIKKDKVSCEGSCNPNQQPKTLLVTERLRSGAGPDIDSLREML